MCLSDWQISDFVVGERTEEVNIVLQDLVQIYFFRSDSEVEIISTAVHFFTKEPDYIHIF